MSDLIESAIKVFVVTWLVITGMSVFFTFGLTAVQIAALSAASTIIAGLLSEGVEASIDNFGTKVSTRDALKPRQIVYGKCRVGGTITHIETSGTDNNKLHTIIVLAGHEIESLEGIYINDTLLTHGAENADGFTYAQNAKYINADNDNAFTAGNSLVRWKFMDGSQTSADSSITGACSLGSTDVFTGVAYIYMEFAFDSEAFGGGAPPTAFVVKGKKVYDPRSDSTSWSNNPALCIRDYIADTTYGLKAVADEINDTTNLGGFASAANTCDTSSSLVTATTASSSSSSTSVALTSNTNNTLIPIGSTVTGTGISGTVTVISRSFNSIILSSAQSIGSGVTLTFGQPSYTCNGFTNMAADGAQILEALLSSCAGKMSYINGKFVMFAGASVTPDKTITDDNLLSPLSIITKSGSGESHNQVKAVYVDSNTRYVSADTPIYTDSTLLANDTPSGESNANYKKALEIQLPFTDTVTMAQRIAKTTLLHSRQQTTVTAITNIGFMQLQPFDWVYLTNERMGWTNKVFEVLSTNLEVVEEGNSDSDSAPVFGTRLVLKEMESAVYNFLASDYTAIGEQGTDTPGGDFSVTKPTSLALAQQNILEGVTYKSDIKATWTNNGDDLIMGTEIAYKLSTDASYTGHLEVGKGVGSALISNVAIGKTYNVKVRHFSANNVFSDYTTAVNITTSDPTSISAPSGFSATGYPVGIRLAWTNPTNTNLRSIKIYRHTASWTPSDDTHLINIKSAEPGKVTSFVDGRFDGIVAGTTYYYTIRAVSHTDVHSPFCTIDSASFTFGKADIGLNSLADLDSGQDGKLDGVETGATVGAVFGTNLYKTGTTNFTAQELKNDSQVWSDVGGSGKPADDATNNGSTIDTSGNITGNISVGATMTLGTNSDDKIVVGNVTIDGQNGRILITD